MPEAHAESRAGALGHSGPWTSPAPKALYEKGFWALIKAINHRVPYDSVYAPHINMEDTEPCIEDSSLIRRPSPLPC